VITYIAWTLLIVFAILVILSGLPKFMDTMDAERAKRERKERRFKTVKNDGLKDMKGYGPLNKEDMAELEGMFGEAGDHESDYN
jgi:hypothetical protein